VRARELGLGGGVHLGKSLRSRFETRGEGGEMTTTMTGTATELDGRCISTIRTLYIDAIQSGSRRHVHALASEAASFAAHQRLANLCRVFDSSRVAMECH
jgi:hypothetical protein